MVDRDAGRSFALSHGPSRTRARATTLLPHGRRDSLGVRFGDFEWVAIDENVGRAEHWPDDGVDLGDADGGRMSVGAFREFDVDELVHGFFRLGGW